MVGQARTRPRLFICEALTGAPFLSFKLKVTTGFVPGAPPSILRMSKTMPGSWLQFPGNVCAPATDGPNSGPSGAWQLTQVPSRAGPGLCFSPVLRFKSSWHETQPTLDGTVFQKVTFGLEWQA